MSDTADRELLARMRAGDDAAFERVFRAHYGALCNYAFTHVHTRADAEEIVQAVFLALWQQRERLELRSSLRAYLLAATRNHALNRSARARLEQRWLDESAGETPELHGSAPRAPDAAVQSQEVSARVREALERLPPGARRVLELRWEHGLHIAEIADTLGISVKGVENQLTRARNALREHLADLIE
jgi:RNA polymerase sigma-70 factor, ECF subfamily